MKIAIIGFGLSGASLLRSLLEHAPENSHFEIDIYESHNELAKGQAYSQDTHSSLINTMSRYLSVELDKPKDFLVWLSEKFNNKPDPNSFVPRSVYGEYLNERFKKFFQSEKVEIFNETVITLNMLEEGFQLFTDSNKNKIYDQIFLAVGHPPYADYYNLYGKENYIHNPYPLTKHLGDIPQEASIGIIGSGLTSIDVVRSLIHDFDWKESITFYIPNHPFDTIAMPWKGAELSVNLTREWLDTYEDFLPLEDLYDQFISDMEINHINLEYLLTNFMSGSHTQILYQLENDVPDLAKIQRYQENIKTIMPDIYNSLSKTDQYQLKKSYASIIDHLRKVTPKESIQDIYEWIKTGRVKFVTGISEIEKTNPDFELKTNENLFFNENYLINATGFQFNPFKATTLQPLLKNLLDKELLTYHPEGGFRVSFPSSQVISSHYGKIESLYLLGPWIASTLYTANDAQITVSHGERVGKLFWDSN